MASLTRKFIRHRASGGWILPATAVMIVVLVILIGIPFVRFHRDHNIATNYYINQAYHGLGQSGAEFAEYQLRRPDNVSAQWIYGNNGATPTTYNFTDGNVQVSISVEDTKVRKKS